MAIDQIEAKRSRALRCHDALDAIFKLEETFPPNDEMRRAIYAVRVELGNLVNGILAQSRTEGP